jgi:hypothetical protein
MLPLALNIPKNAVGAVDCYINDLCLICVDIDDNTEMCPSAVALTLDIVGCPLNLKDRLPCDTLLSLKKLQCEGKQEEIKVVLGWELNASKLTIALTQVKFEIWLNEIQPFLDKAYAPNTSHFIICGEAGESCVHPAT